MARLRAVPTAPAVEPQVLPIRFVSGRCEYPGVPMFRLPEWVVAHGTVRRRRMGCGRRIRRYGDQFL